MALSVMLARRRPAALERDVATSSRNALRWLAVLLAAGCGGRTDQTPEVEKGASLRPRFYVSPDADPVFREWYDTDLKVPCRFARVAGGESRCIPKTIAYVKNVYADAACSHRIADQWFQSLSTEAEAYLIESVDAGCSQYERVYQAGPQVAIARTFGKTEAGACESTLDTSTMRRSVGAPISDETFVAANPTTEGDAELGIQFVEAADGVRIPQDFSDLKRRVSCRPLAFGGSLRCIPAVSAVMDSTYLDDECTRPIAFFGSVCESPAVITRSNPDSCSTDLFGVGAESYLAFRDTFGRYETTCLAPSNTESDTYHFFEVGPRLPADTFPALRAEIRGDHRIKSVYVVSDGGTERLDETRFDAELGLPCAIQFAGDSSWRCLPVSSIYGISSVVVQNVPAMTFSDSSCAQPIFSWKATSCSPLPAIVTADGAMGVEVYSIGPEYDGDTYFEQHGSGDCVPADAYRISDGPWYTSQRLAPDRFVSFHAD